MVGAGPAGLSAAHRLAMLGHDVVVYDAKTKAGGLNEFGIAAYKSTNDFAAREVDWLLQIGGITMDYGKKLGEELSLDALKAGYDAVFLSIGLAGVNALRAPGEDKDGVRDAVEFIAELRQADDLTALPVGRNVVVIGGGMTAVDAAVQSKLLGAENVTIAYRRGREEMGASRFEQDLAASKGVKLMFNVHAGCGAWQRRSGRDRIGVYCNGHGRQGVRHRRDRAAGRGSGVQGHRPDLGRPARCAGA